MLFGKTDFPFPQYGACATRKMHDIASIKHDSLWLPLRGRTGAFGFSAGFASFHEFQVSLNK